MLPNYNMLLNFFDVIFITAEMSFPLNIIKKESRMCLCECDGHICIMNLKLK